MILFGKTDPDLDVRAEEKQERTIDLHLKAWVCPFVDGTKAKLGSFGVAAGTLRVSSALGTKVLR